MKHMQQHCIHTVAAKRFGLHLFVYILLGLVLTTPAWAQQRLPIVRATQQKATIEDGEHVRIDWILDPRASPDIYYVNIPRRKGHVTFRTDQEVIRFKTEYGKSYDFLVVLRDQDSCLVRIAAQEQPGPMSLPVPSPFPHTIPFTLIGSRVYFQGCLNGQEKVSVQFDLGAGTSCINAMSSEKLQVSFDGKAMLDNSQGVQEVRVSSGNGLHLGECAWQGVALMEVGNMRPFEDLIIGNGLFRDKIIELDYDKGVFIVHDQLPAYAKSYKKQPVYYEQDRPRFKADFVHEGKKYSFWFLFDTGREGTMLIGEDFTGQRRNWSELQELQVLNGRKIVQLDARIAGTEFKNIVTNAADPAKPAGRPTLFGNQVLNHFNVILDNQQGYIYLKSNSRRNAPYADYQQYLQDIQKHSEQVSKQKP